MKSLSHQVGWPHLCLSQPIKTLIGDSILVECSAVFSKPLRFTVRDDVELRLCTLHLQLAWWPIYETPALYRDRAWTLIGNVVPLSFKIAEAAILLMQANTSKLHRRFWMTKKTELTAASETAVHTAAETLAQKQLQIQTSAGNQQRKHIWLRTLLLMLTEKQGETHTPSS